MIPTKRTISLREAIPLAGIEGGVMYLKDGRACIGYRLDCLEEESLNAAGYQALNTAFAQALGALPVGAVVQRLDAYDYVPYRADAHAAEDGLGYFALRHDEHFEARPILQHRAYLLISLGPKGERKHSPVNTLFSLGKSLYPNPFAGIEERMQAVKRLGAACAATLAGQGLRLHPMDEADYRQLYLSYMNLDFGGQPQRVSRSLSPHRQGLGLGEKEVRLLNLIGQGLRVDHVLEEQGVVQPYIRPLTHALAFPHLLLSTFLVEDKEKALKDLDLQRRINASLGQMANQDTDLQAEEIEAFTEDIRRDNQAIIGVGVALMIWDEQPEQLSHKLNKALTAFSKMAGAEVLVEGIDTTNLFFALAPGNGFQNYRWLRMGALQGSIYTHFHTTYRSQTGMHLCDRHGYPLEVCLFNLKLNNQNAIVVGPTGSGKSFTVGSWIIQRYEQGARQIVIDVGGTYKHVVSALGGQYLAYDPAAPMSLNPFFTEALGDCWQVDGDKLIFLITLISRIWKGEGQLSQSERASLSRIIPAFYSEYRSEAAPRLVDFAAWLEAWSETDAARKLVGGLDVQQLLLCLSPFTEGQYQAVLNAEWDTDLSTHSLICFDMARVKNNPLLYPIVSLLITELALDQIRRFGESRKFIYMDEAWSMLAASMGAFVELMYRTIRKNNGAMYIITQGVMEITQSGVGEAILANADTKVLLHHSNQQARQKVSQVMGLTDHELDLFASLRKQAHSRELLIKQGERAKVYRLEVSPHMGLALSSTPEVRDRLSRLIDRKGSIQTAITQYLQQHG